MSFLKLLYYRGIYIEQSVISNKAMQIIFLKFRENLLPNACVHGYAHALGMLLHALRMGSHFTHQVWNGIARHGISRSYGTLF